MALKKLAADAALKLGEAMVGKAPDIIDNYVKKKEEKRSMLIIILAIFALNLNYISIFNTTVLNAIINIIYGIIVLVLFILFFIEEKDIFKNKSLFIKVLMIVLILFGTINFFYHVGYAISNLFGASI